MPEAVVPPKVRLPVIVSCGTDSGPESVPPVSGRKPPSPPVLTMLVTVFTPRDQRKSSVVGVPSSFTHRVFGRRNVAARTLPVIPLMSAQLGADQRHLERVGAGQPERPVEAAVASRGAEPAIHYP